MQKSWGDEVYNFEMNITTRKCLRCADILTILNNLECKITGIKTVIDNKFDSITEISLSELSAIDFADKNVLVIFQASRNDIPCGAIISKNSEGYLCSLWFECDDSSKMDAACINESNADKYFEAIRFVYDIFNPFSIVHASFGCEMRISDDTNLVHKIEKSAALAWLVPKCSLKKTPITYTAFEFGEQYLIVLNQE